MRRRTLSSAALAALLGGVIVALPQTAHAASSVAGDVNGDGYRDLVVSSPDATVAGHARAGAVVIHYGSAAGLGKRTVLTQNSPGIPGGAEAGDRFGAAVAVADLDGNGYNDLVVGAPGEEVYGDIGGGLVTVVRGAATGFGAANVVDDPYPYDHDAWGRTLAVGKFGEYADGNLPVIAVGASGNWVSYLPARAKTEPVGGRGFAFSPQYGVTGLVAPPPGQPAGYLVATGRGHATDPWFYDGEGSESRTFVDNPLYDTRERAGGLSAAVADLNGDGELDLVTGNPLEPGQDPDAALGGKVTVTYGGVGQESGVTQVITQNTAGVPGGSEAGDRFGAAVSVGDTDKDGWADLVIGAPGEDGNAGTVAVVRGSASGLVTATARGFTQNTAGVPGGSEPGDGFGGSVLLRDLTGDGYADLTVGGSGEDGGNGALWFLPKATTTGAVSLTAGGAGLSTAGSPHFGAVTTSSR